MLVCLLFRGSPSGDLSDALLAAIMMVSHVSITSSPVYGVCRVFVAHPMVLLSSD